METLPAARTKKKKERKMKEKVIIWRKITVYARTTAGCAGYAEIRKIAAKDYGYRIMYEGSETVVLSGWAGSVTAVISILKNCLNNLDAGCGV